MSIRVVLGCLGFSALGEERASDIIWSEFCQTLRRYQLTASETARSFRAVDILVSESIFPIFVDSPNWDIDVRNWGVINCLQLSATRQPHPCRLLYHKKLFKSSPSTCPSRSFILFCILSLCPCASGFLYGSPSEYQVVNRESHMAITFKDRSFCIVAFNVIFAYGEVGIGQILYDFALFMSEPRMRASHANRFSNLLSP